MLWLQVFAITATVIVVSLFILKNNTIMKRFRLMQRSMNNTSKQQRRNNNNNNTDLIVIDPRVFSYPLAPAVSTPSGPGPLPVPTSVSLTNTTSIHLDITVGLAFGTTILYTVPAGKRAMITNYATTPISIRTYKLQLGDPITMYFAYGTIGVDPDPTINFIFEPGDEFVIFVVFGDPVVIHLDILLCDVSTCPVRSVRLAPSLGDGSQQLIYTGPANTRTFGCAGYPFVSPMPLTDWTGNWIWSFNTFGDNTAILQTFIQRANPPITSTLFSNTSQFLSQGTPIQLPVTEPGETPVVPVLAGDQVYFSSAFPTVDTVPSYWSNLAVFSP